MKNITKIVEPRSVEILRNPKLNKGSAFSAQERNQHGLRGLLPPQIQTMAQQIERVLLNIEREGSNLNRYSFLRALQARNETLFFRILVDYVEDMMPLVYTPTVGLACQEFGHIYQHAEGLYISAEDAGSVAEVLANWPIDDVRCIVVTDGERILGLGDLGANGMGIPIGKLALYTACGGVAPQYCLPIMLDVGTNNQTLLNDPLYLGLNQRRLAPGPYNALVAEFVAAVTTRYPHALLQFEDFGNHNAFRFLEQYRNKCCAFNDDIQGTGAVALAGLLSAARMIEIPLKNQTILFFGAGEAGIGIADMIVAAMMQQGLSEAQARRRCWFVDSQGLVVASRTDLAVHKRPYAHDHAQISDLKTAIETLRPTTLIGVSGQGQAFTAQHLAEMGYINERPIIFALSNPTSHAECTASDAYINTDGRAIFASGSPFAPVEFNNQTFVPGQGNNAYIFPGIGLAVAACGISRITDEMILAAAHALSDFTSTADFEIGRVYPALKQIRNISVKIATAIATIAYHQGLATVPQPSDLAEHIQASVYQPVYVPLHTGETAAT